MFSKQQWLLVFLKAQMDMEHGLGFFSLVNFEEIKAQAPSPSNKFAYVHFTTITFIMLLGHALFLQALGVRILIYLKLKF